MRRWRGRRRRGCTDYKRTVTGENFHKCAARRLLFKLDIGECLWVIAAFKHVDLL